MAGFQNSGKEFILRFFRSRILYSYILREYLKSFGLTLLACSLLFLLTIIISVASEFEGFGLSTGEVALATPFLLPFSLTYSMPLAAMIAAILVFGRLTAENEIQAAQSGGASILQISLPLLLCSLVISAISLWCNDQGIAWGFDKLNNKILTLDNPDLQDKLKQPGSSVSLQLDKGGMLQVNMLPIEMVKGEAKFPIHVAHFERGQLQQNLYARNHKFFPLRKQTNGSGFQMDVALYDGQTLGADPSYFDKAEFSIDLPPLSSQFRRGSGRDGMRQNWEEAQKIKLSIPARRRFLVEQAADLAGLYVAGSPADPSTAALAAAGWVNTLRAQNVAASAKKKARQKLVEFHRKLSLALMPFCLIFLGIGLGLLVRKRNRLIGFISGILAYFLIYYPLMVIFKEMANASQVPPEALWVPNILVVGLGLLLWYLYEKGMLGGGAPQWTQQIGSKIGTLFKSIWIPIQKLDFSFLMPFKRKMDRHVASSFLVPLAVVSLAVGVLRVLLDVLEHGSEVIRGVILAGKPLLWLEPRSVVRALWDVCVYYGIRSLDTLFYLLPALILLAGVLTVTIMVRNNEHLICKSSGTRLQRVFMPMLLLCVLFSISVSVVRETVMPGMIVERDRLKPYIYHRSPKSKSVAGQTLDADKKTVIYEIARYSRNLHQCDGLRIYSPMGIPNGQYIPRLTADSASWDVEKSHWSLWTQDEDGPIQKTLLKGTSDHFQPHGTQLFAHSVTPTEQLNASPKAEWSGELTPAFLDSKQLGPGVMPFYELLKLSHYPEFASELWRRPLDWLTGVLLLMVCIPLLVSQEIKNPLIGIGKCILLGALYLGMNLGVAEAARQEVLATWAPTIPHVIFLCFGSWRYFYRMDT